MTSSLQSLETALDAAWEARAEISDATQGATREAVEACLALLDSGQARVAEKVGGEWVVRQWLKKAVLLSFRLHPNRILSNPAGGAIVEPGLGPWWDKVADKFGGWGPEQFAAAGF